MAAARPDGPRGRLITVEGVEGAGKSTQVESLRAWLTERGADRRRDGRARRDRRRRQRSGGSSAEVDRVTPLTEAFLFAASRAEHVERVVRPALAAGHVVVCDRYVDSTVAYQGYGRGLPLETIARLNRLATEGLMPDLTLVLDLDVAEGLRRARARRGALAACDPFERLALEFHERVRKGFWAIQRPGARARHAGRRGPCPAGGRRGDRAPWSPGASDSRRHDADRRAPGPGRASSARRRRSRCSSARIALDRLAHAYAFVGPSGVGPPATAVAFAQAASAPPRDAGRARSAAAWPPASTRTATCVVPTPPRDNPKGAPMIRIEQVRELERTAALAPHEARRKVFILDDADRMTLADRPGPPQDAGGAAAPDPSWC